MPPKCDIRLGAIVLRRQPPVVGVWCKPPSSTWTAPGVCGHHSDACKGELAACDLCGFTYCARHYPKHRRRFECPVDVWLNFNRRRVAWYARVQANPRAKPKVDVHFPDEPDEVGDG